MGSAFFCPFCHALLRKSEIEQSYSNSSLVAVPRNLHDKTQCPICKEYIDRLDLLNGKYDKKWWQFFDMGGKTNKPLQKKSFNELNRAELAELELKKMREQK